MILEIFVVVLVFYLSWNYFGGKKSKDFPPGPFAFPLLGHLPLLGESPHKTLLAWKKRYGPIIGVQFGSYPTVVINDAKLIREALNMPAFSGRPHLEAMKYRSGGTIKGIIFSEGQHWLDQRRFALRNLRDFGYGTKSMEAKIQDEVTELIEKFEAQAGKPMQMRNVFNAAVVNALWSIMLGERMQQDDPLLLDAIHRLTSSLDDSNFIASLATFMPWLIKVAPKWSGFEKMIRQMPPIINFATEQLTKHRKSYIPGEPRDLFDLYEDEVEKTTDPQSSFHRSQDVMTFTFLDLFIAGAETTSTTLTWMYAFLITWPEYQQKVQKELDAVIGKERLASLSDRPNLPYVDALLNEVMRFASLVPLSVFHSTTEDVHFHGFFIPKGTMVMPNLYSAHFDPQIWGDPEKFRPERFLNEQGRPQKNENLIPFSTGKRACLGESLARDELFIFATHLLQKFDASTVDGTPPDLEPRVGAVLLPKPFEILLKVR